jgi:hypothetical protein
MLDVFPDLPIVIDEYCHPSNMDNIFSALGHNDRVIYIGLVLEEFERSEFEDVFVAMEEQFPALAYFRLFVKKPEGLVPVLPNSFLGGSAPHLRSLLLSGVPIPGLPKLLLSATGLVDLSVAYIPPSGYISPETMITSLSALTSLEYFEVGFIDPPYQESRRPLPPIRVFPALKTVRFRSDDLEANEYLEEFVAWIDAPLLDLMEIVFTSFNRQRVHVIPHLSQFISRTTKLKVASFDRTPVTLPLPTQLHHGVHCHKFLKISS